MDFTRLLTRLAASRPVDTPPTEVILPQDDHDCFDSDGDALGYAEGQSFLIEYTDSKRQTSRRRITVFNIRINPDGIPLLVARCHERNANRTFRVDRIVCCIDYDGEVFEDVPSYLHETFGMTIGKASAKPPEQVRRWEEIKSIIAPNAVLLAVISRADHHVHASETNAATDHLCRLVERSGMFLTDDECKVIWRYVARLRPGADAINWAVEHIANQNHDHIMRAIRACIEVVEADGVTRPEERQALNEISRELIGINLL